MKVVLNEGYTFNTFIATEDNQALNIAKIIAKKSGRQYNPVLFYGKTGTGKTHLIQAIGNELKKEFDVIYTIAEIFVEEFVGAIIDNKLKNFREKYCNANVLLIDDIQFLKNKLATTEELSLIFDILYNKNIQMVFTCDKPIAELIGINDRMISRITGGLSVCMPTYNFNSKCEMVKFISKAIGILIEPDGIEKIANDTGDDLRYIYSSLNIINANMKFEEK
jgi:chromosomal replication initiator protein